MDKLFNDCTKYTYIDYSDDDDDDDSDDYITYDAATGGLL